MWQLAIAVMFGLAALALLDWLAVADRKKAL